MGIRTLLACAMGAVMVLTTNQPTGAQVRSLDEIKTGSPAPRRQDQSVQSYPSGRCEADRRVADEPRSRSLGGGLVQGRARLRSKGRRAREAGRQRQGACRHLFPRVRLLPRRPLSGRQLTRQEEGLSRFRAHVPQGSAAFRESAADRRDPVPGRKLIGYLSIPKGATRPPVVMHWGGVDGWKEDREIAESASCTAPDWRH